MANKLTRPEVYNILNGERDYQDNKYGATLSSARQGDGERTIDEFALYLSGLSNKLASFACEQTGPDKKLEFVRKIGALAVQCMEQHGAPRRAGY